MPGTGKSTVGVILAKLLGYSFTDTDILISSSRGATLPQLIEKLGWEGLIKIEGETGERLECSSTVIATGGSMVFSAGAMRHLKTSGVTVWLKTPLEVLTRRLSAGLESRGVAAPAGTTLEQLAAKREPYYGMYADYAVNCAADADSTAQLIAQLLRENGFFD